MMEALFFPEDYRHFDGSCVRFAGHCGGKRVLCGVTAAALKEHDRQLPRHGLIPAELFLEAYDRMQIAIHEAARRKFAGGELEPQGELLVLIHRQDL